MKKAFLLITAITLLFFSCATTDEVQLSEETESIIVETPSVEPVPTVEPEVPVSVIEDLPVPELFDEPDVVAVVEDESEPVEEVIEEPVLPEPEPEPEPEAPVEPELSEEYLRSISNLSGEDAVIVSPEVFEEDKNQIFMIINELDRIMKKKDFDGWLSHLTPDSAEYWSNRHNLLELSRHLFSTDDFHINNIREYFEFFFIPARRGRLVDEIRYVTPDLVKVVQYKNKTDVIYYFFEKQDGVWKLKLDTLNN